MLFRSRYAISLQIEAGTAAVLDHQGKISGVFLAAGGVDGGAFVERAKQQEGIHEAPGLQADADRLKGVDIQAAHFDVLHTAVAQGLNRPLAAADHAFGPDGGIVFVFDLQYVGADLYPLPVALGAERLGVVTAATMRA